MEVPMNCPRCHDSVLFEIDRDTITIDRCDRCRGIWLDRGELEKLLARGKDESSPRHRRDNDEPDDDDDDRGRHRGARRSWWEIFD
jgi:Zn-finger nucleic acid-binding protein